MSYYAINVTIVLSELPLKLMLTGTPSGSLARDENIHSREMTTVINYHKPDVAPMYLLQRIQKRCGKNS